MGAPSPLKKHMARRWNSKTKNTTQMIRNCVASFAVMAASSALVDGVMHYPSKRTLHRRALRARHGDRISKGFYMVDLQIRGMKNSIGEFQNPQPKHVVTRDELLKYAPPKPAARTSEVPTGSPEALNLVDGFSKSQLVLVGELLTAAITPVIEMFDARFVGLHNNVIDITSRLDTMLESHTEVGEPCAVVPMCSKEAKSALQPSIVRPAVVTAESGNTCWEPLSDSLLSSGVSAGDDSRECHDDSVVQSIPLSHMIAEMTNSRQRGKMRRYVFVKPAARRLEPKRPPSAYFLFTQEEKNQLGDQAPNGGWSAFANTINTKWRQIDQSAFVSKANGLMEIYERELQEYRSARGY